MSLYMTSIILLLVSIVSNQKNWMWSGTSVAHKPSVREDLGSILHINPGWHFSEAFISLLSGNRLKNNIIHLQYFDAKLKWIILFYWWLFQVNLRTIDILGVRENRMKKNCLGASFWPLKKIVFKLKAKFKSLNSGSSYFCSEVCKVEWLIYECSG